MEISSGTWRLNCCPQTLSISVRQRDRGHSTDNHVCATAQKQTFVRGTGWYCFRVPQFLTRCRVDDVRYEFVVPAFQSGCSASARKQGLPPASCELHEKSASLDSNRDQFSDSGRPLQYRNMAQDPFFIAARLHHGFFLLGKVPLAVNMFKRKLLSGARLFITPECNIVEIAARLGSRRLAGRIASDTPPLKVKTACRYYCQD